MGLREIHTSSSLLAMAKQYRKAALSTAILLSLLSYDLLADSKSPAMWAFAMF